MLGLPNPHQQQQDAAAQQHPRAKRAVGVLALAGSCASQLRLVIKAPVVVSACGSIHTPALLLRSKIRGGGNVGANLRIHPCAFARECMRCMGGARWWLLHRAPIAPPHPLPGTCVVGLFPPDAQLDSCVDATATASTTSAAAAPRAADPPRHGSVRCWEGAIMSIFSRQVASWEDGGYGALLYTVVRAWVGEEGTALARARVRACVQPPAAFRTGWGGSGGRRMGGAPCVGGYVGGGGRQSGGGGGGLGSGACEQPPPPPAAPLLHPPRRRCTLASLPPFVPG